jgi:hypothetical protein
MGPLLGPLLAALILLPLIALLAWLVALLGLEAPSIDLPSVDLPRSRLRTSPHPVGCVRSASRAGHSTPRRTAGRSSPTTRATGATLPRCGARSRAPTSSVPWTLRAPPSPVECVAGLPVEFVL